MLCSVVQAEARHTVETLRAAPPAHDSHPHATDRTTSAADRHLIADLQSRLTQAHAQHETAMHDMKSKLTWYLENQGLIEQYSNKAKHDDETIHKLTQKLVEVEAALPPQVSMTRHATAHKHVYRMHHAL